MSDGWPPVSSIPGCRGGSGLRTAWVRGAGHLPRRVGAWCGAGLQGPAEWHSVNHVENERSTFERSIFFVNHFENERSKFERSK